ncbi:putative dNA primase [Lyngbya aestuarii BL J]|uniref:Putative dNA primase n=2 Tax=Lyngbya aestuarii TaxID=118322 RepID=U7QS70_9CYAN|nr:putative dNA primase [Lyngbya aestuarii BL J]
MTGEIYVLNSMKISSEFAARLSRMNSGEMIRVIVFLKTETQGTKKTPQEVQQIAENKLDNIRPILTKYKGELIGERPNVLGSIAIKITVAGVYALAESESVKMIVEDQAIFPR